ncbi:hypothetical protein BS17DRAFT_726849 [Gyrodon lividus]|nr:hypothetical protein BS17DRAFT_726849 [Gyrodon lividus]
MDTGILKIDHGSDVYVIRSCHNEDGSDLLALGGEHSVEIYHISLSSTKRLASFHIGTRVTALAWSPRTLSPSSSDGWLIEIAAAGIDFGLHLLTKSVSLAEHIFPFGGGLSGHHGRVNDMCFCGGRDQESASYVATVSDDRMLMVWDLHPTLDISSWIPSTDTSLNNSSFPHNPRPQPTAYVITFSHPLTTVSSHPASSKELLVSDCRGSIFLTDWRTDPELTEQGSWRHSTLVELVEPHALADSLLGASSQWTGFAAWRRDNVDIIGATYGPRFAIWDMSKLRGGRPTHTGTSFPDRGHAFRWCPTNPDYFAIAAHSIKKGAVLHVHNVGYVHAQPSVINVAPHPHHIRDFDFMALRGQPLLVVAFGRQVAVFSLGDE